MKKSVKITFVILTPMKGRSWETISDMKESLQKKNVVCSTFSRQDAALKKYAAKHKIDYVRIYGDDSSGKDFIRREWIQLEKALHEGDTIVFKDLSRFTRQAEEGYQKYLDLIGKGITLVFIDNPTVCSDYITKLIDTADQQNIVTRTAMEGIVKLMLIVELDRAEQERLQLIQRTPQEARQESRSIG